MTGHLLDESAKGVYIIAATPFTHEGALDLPSLDRLIGFYIEAGVHGITILGMMGEAQKLTFDEQRAVIDRVLKQVAGELPVVVGVSAPGLAQLAALSEDAMSEGAAGVMVAPPPGLTTDEHIEGYVRQAIDAVGYDVPVVLQDYPQATGVHLS
ncbi:MAG: dihydrodipicolinate synthase family protein, partial [Alphaproteobacteria bacterium]|nr:dihydrodipicolinate synthase family protein [Alphaproteobacteria bacterium]